MRDDPLDGDERLAAAGGGPMTLGDVVSALATLALLTGALLLARREFARHLRRLTARTATGLDDLAADLVDRTHPLALVTVASWAALVIWLPASPAQAFAAKVLSVVLAAQAGVWGGHLVESVAGRRKSVAAADGHAGDGTAWAALSILTRAVLWAVVALVALDNVGVDVTALVAGLGIGGIAVGLALQSVLGDVFASLAIVLDRPFAIGDFLVVDDVTGTVEHVGIKTTRVRALSGEQIVISNAELLKSRIRNFQRLAERRNVLSFGVLYDTSPDVLARIPDIVREVVEEQPATRLDRAHLCGFGESSIDFELAYYFADSDYNRHMDVQQAVLLALFRRFAALGIGFAFPTRTVHLVPAAAASASSNTMNTNQSGA